MKNFLKQFPSHEYRLAASASLWAALALAFMAGPNPARCEIPKYDHVLLVIMENHAINQILGSSSAPYLNKLINDSNAALFTQSFGLSHPSEPNYVGLFCGSMHGITDDNIPKGIPFTDENLGSELIAKKLGYAAYSEDLPSVGSMVEESGGYAQKHAPWCYWQGTGTNGLPPATHMPFKSFPTDFTAIPTVTFMVPNLTHDIHDGTISQGDTFIKNSFDGYVQWAKTHNSLFILTFDEDDESTSKNQVLTFFVGQHVKKGSYNEKINHYSLLRTLEDMYGLTHAGAAATTTPITDVWEASTRIGSPLSGKQGGTGLQVFPGYGREGVLMSFQPVSSSGASLDILSPEGLLLSHAQVTPGQSSFAWKSGNRPRGQYFVRLKADGNTLSESFLLAK